MGLGSFLNKPFKGAEDLRGGIKDAFGKKGPSQLYSGPTLPAWLSQGGTDYFTRAQALSNRPFQMFDPNSQRSWTPDQNQAVGQMRGLLNTYGGLGNDAINQFGSTVRGDYLDPAKNPAWGTLAGRIGEAYNNTIRPQTDAAFARAGAFGGGNSAYDQTVALNNRGLADSLSNLAGNMYQTERGRQDAAMYNAPQAFQSLLSPSKSLFDVGNLQYQDFLTQQQYPFAQLDVLGNAFSRIAPSYTGQFMPNPNQRSGLADMLGGGLSGAGLGFMVGGPMGAAIGGGLGALGGGLS